MSEVFKFHFFPEKIVDGWERTETDNGVPYFVKYDNFFKDLYSYTPANKV